MHIRKILRILFLLLFFANLALTTFFLLVLIPFLPVLVPLLEQFNDLPASVIMRIESNDCLENFTLVFPIYTYQNELFEVWHFLSPGSSENYSISIVDTEYGKMWEIKIERLNVFGEIFFEHPRHEPLNIFDIELKPVLNESVIKDETNEQVIPKSRYYQKIVNLTIPVYIYYEGNVTDVNVELFVASGLDCLLGLLPIAPKHDGKVYSGHRSDEFVIKFKGWGNLTGVSTVYLVYQ